MPKNACVPLLAGVHGFLHCPSATMCFSWIGKFTSEMQHSLQNIITRTLERYYMNDRTLLHYRQNIITQTFVPRTYQQLQQIITTTDWSDKIKVSYVRFFLLTSSFVSNRILSSKEGKEKKSTAQMQSHIVRRNRIQEKPLLFQTLCLRKPVVIESCCSLFKTWNMSIWKTQTLKLQTA